MPSMSSMPVAFFHNARVAAGNASPADTHLRRLDRSNLSACAAMARYDVGAVNRTVARCCAMAGSSMSGGARSSSNVDAPTRIGNSRSPPSPNVKASGGLPVNTSSAWARSVERGQQSQAASTSWWKCIVPFGWPVVPDVKAISAVSSPAVRTSANESGFLAASVSTLSASALPNNAMRESDGHAAPAARRSAASLASHSACVTRAFAMMSISSLVRSNGMVATAMPPALITANQHAASNALLGPRSNTRLPGTSCRSSTSTCAIRLACASSSEYVQRVPSGARIAGRFPHPFATAPSRSSVAQLNRSGYRSSGSSNRSSGQRSRGGRWSRAKVSRWAV